MGTFKTVITRVYKSSVDSRKTTVDNV